MPRNCTSPLLGDARPEVHAPVRPGGIRQAVADGGYGTMMALRGTRTIRVTLIEGAGELKLVTPD